MPVKKSTMAHEREIIESLKDTPKSITTLAETLGIQYYTVRRIVASLTDRGIIKISDVVNRNSIYMYNGDEREHDYIPRFTDIIQRASYKVIGLLEMVGREAETKSTQASMALSKHVTDLMYLAIQADNGSPVGKELDSVRDKITKDFLYLKNAANLYEQILQEPRLWEERHLAKMTHDPDFNVKAVLDSKEYYDGN